MQSQNISDYINVVLRHTAPPQQHKIWHDLAIREIFTPEQLRYVNARSVSQGLVELSNLILYRAPVVYSIRSSYKKNPTYLYTFDYRGEFHRFAHFGNPLPFGVDASLSDDSVYLFPYPKDASNLNPQDKSLARALVAMWVSFAQNGIPNQNSNVWPKVTSEYGPFLRFTNSRLSILELDQHFGESINVPNIYAQYFNTTNSTSTTTTTTTRRPYYPEKPYRPPQQPQYRQPAFNDYYAREQEVRRQQLLREQQERELKLSEQQEREQQQQEELLREEEERQREQQQRETELQRELQQRAEFEREQRQREQQQREYEARQHVDEDEQDERELQQREYELRLQQERQQEREQQEREQTDREQQAHLLPMDSEEQRLQQEREEQERVQEEREQESREQHEREQQQREQLEREQQEREQQEREQQGRGEQTYATNEENAPDPSAYPSYEDYVKAYTLWVEELSSLYNPESFASAEQEASPDDELANDRYAQPDENQLYSDNNPQRIKLMRRYQRFSF